MEKWDAYDKNFNKIDDIIITRGDKIPDGMYHLVSDIIVKHQDGTYLLMQRDFNKNYGGMWEASAGGSALYGEDAYACAKRELKEETGIDTNNLIELGKIIDSKTHSIYVEFLCNTDCDKNSIIKEENETIAYKWVSKSELINLPKDILLTDRIQKFIKDIKK